MKATLSSLLPALCLALAMLSPQVFAVVLTGDSFANPGLYTGAVQSSSNAGATAEPHEPNHNPGTGITPFHSLWWKFTAPLTGIYQVDTITSNFDTALSVYTGTALTNLVRVGYDDDGGGSTTSKLLLPLSKGVTYRIAVDGFDNTKTGTVNLHVQLARYFAVRTYQAFIGADTTLDGSGMVTFSVTNFGVLTGKFLLGTRSFPFTAGVDQTGLFTASVARSGLLPATISATIPQATFSIGGMPAACSSGPVPCSIKIGLSPNAPPAYPTAPGDPALVPYFPAIAPYTAANPCPRAGRYPFMTTGNSDTGYSVAAVTVGTTGVCTVSGRLGDGTAFACTAPLMDNQGGGLTGLAGGGSFVYHAPLYAGKGRVSGQSTFNAGITPATVNGSGAWCRPQAAPGAAFLPRGINIFYTQYGSRYTAPVTGHRVDAAFDAGGGVMTCTATRAGYPTVNQSVTLSPANLFTYMAPNANLVKLTVVPSTGILSGSVKFTGAPAASAIYAVLIHNSGIGTKFFGYVTGTTGYGTVIIGP